MCGGLADRLRGQAASKLASQHTSKQAGRQAGKQAGRPAGNYPASQPASQPVTLTRLPSSPLIMPPSPLLSLSQALELGTNVDGHGWSEARSKSFLQME